MSCHESITRASPRGGLMAASSSLYRKRISRQRLRWAIQLVAPGGKSLRFAEDAFQQQGYQYLAVQPGPATRVGLLGQLPQPQDRLHPLEAQLDLPSAAIPLQHAGRREDLFGRVGPHVEVARQERGPPRHTLLLLAGPLF